MIPRAGVLALFLLASLHSSAQQAVQPQSPTSAALKPSSSPAATFRLGVDYVEVDARVTDRHCHFVPGLSKNDFRLFQDGKVQTISAFSVVDIPVESAAQQPNPHSAPKPDVVSNAEPFSGRPYVLVIDDLHTDAGQAGRAMHVTSQFINDDLGAHDLMAVVHTLGAHNENRAFTSDVAG